MGIFDKKTKGRKSEEFDSPVETIDLSSAPEAGGGSEAKSAAEVAPKSTAPPATAATAEATASDAPAATPATPIRSAKKARVVDQDYGIEEAIALMRTLPADSIELVVRVVKQTLESTHIDIPTIIVDATAKQERITNRIGVLKEEITGLEQEIAARSTEIGNLEADHEETSMVKERLELAEKLGQKDKAQAKDRPRARESSLHGTLPSPLPTPGKTSSGPNTAAKK